MNWILVGVSVPESTASVWVSLVETPFRVCANVFIPDFECESACGFIKHMGSFWNRYNLMSLMEHFNRRGLYKAMFLRYCDLATLRKPRFMLEFPSLMMFRCLRCCSIKLADTAD